MVNEIPVLDKGYVALLSSSMSRDTFLSLKRDYFKDKLDPRLLDIPTIHLQIKCPLFVQLTFAEHALTYIVNRTQGKPEAFIPTIADVCAKDLEASEAIAEDISQTTDALLINPKAYQSEGCDLFISQVISPISVYNVLVVSGTLSQWLSYISQTNLPAPIAAYRNKIEEAVMSDFHFLKETLSGIENEQGKAPV